MHKALWGRERERSSDFLTAINDHRQYLKRKKLAEEMRLSAANREQSTTDYRLKPGEKIVIRLPGQKASSHGSVHLPAEEDEEEWGEFVGTM